MTDNLKGILAVLGGSTAFVLSDAIVKLVSAELPAAEIIVVRGVLATVFLTAGVFALGAARPLSLLLRLASAAAATTFIVISLRDVPLAIVNTVLQVTPLAVTAGAALVYRDRVGLSRWAAATAGFLGVVLIVKPGVGDLGIAAYVVLIALACATVRDLTTRGLHRDIPSIFVAAASSAAIVPAGFLGPVDGFRRPLLRGQYAHHRGSAHRRDRGRRAVPLRRRAVLRPARLLVVGQHPRCAGVRRHPSGGRRGPLHPASRAVQPRRQAPAGTGKKPRPMNRNRMKEKIASGQPALGCSVMFPSPQIAEILGYAGFDWVLIDCEHGSIGLADVELMAMACDAVGITPIARPKTNSASDIQSVMDRGVMGVQVPHVNSAEDAHRAVAAVKFGPGAARGLAAGTRPDSWGLGARMPEFTQAANAQSLVCVQLEHPEALQNLDSILAVEDIDVFFIGPSDLSQSMGFPGDPKAPPVAEAIEAALARIVSAGRVPGMPATADTVADVVAKGCRYVYTHLPRLIGAGSAAFLQAGRRPEG